MVDHLAQILSEKTGSRFEVRRPRVPTDPLDPTGPQQMRYLLMATRSDFTYVFQRTRPMKRLEMERWLASIYDMVVMGFIPVEGRADGA
jgi:hypothetical protein